MGFLRHRVKMRDLKVWYTVRFPGPRLGPHGPRVVIIERPHAANGLVALANYLLDIAMFTITRLPAVLLNNKLFSVFLPTLGKVSTLELIPTASLCQSHLNKSSPGTQFVSHIHAP